MTKNIKNCTKKDILEDAAERFAEILISQIELEKIHKYNKAKNKLKNVKRI